MLAQANHAGAPATHTREDDDERLYSQLESLARLAAFPAAKLPLDLAVIIGAAADAAKDRIAALMPRYCGFGIGEVVEVAGAGPSPSMALVERMFINEAGTASILLRPISEEGADLGRTLQFPLFYAKSGLLPGGQRRS